MGKVNEALLQIESIQDRTERAMMLGGLVSTLFKLKGATPVMIGRLAYDTYLGNSNEQSELILGSLSGHFSPRLLQEVFVDQLHAEGFIWKWKLANTVVKFTGEAVIERKDLCRDFQTDFGVVKLVPVEELAAERVLASFYPQPNPHARSEAKRLLALGLTETLIIDWHALQQLCDSPLYRAGEQLAALRTETKAEVDAVLATDEETAEPEVTETVPAGIDTTTAAGASHA